MDKGNKILFGYKDEFYCFKLFGESSLKNLVNKLDKLKCIITENDYEKREINIKAEFIEYLSNENSIYKNTIINNLKLEFCKEHPEIAVTNNGDVNIYNRTAKNSDNNFYTIAKIDVENDYTLFINENLYLLCEFLKYNSIYLGKSIDLFMTSFLLQPIKIKYNDKEYFINVRMSVYSTGNIIIQYTIPIENIEFKYICNNRNYKIDFKCFIPQYLIGESVTYDYCNTEYTLGAAFSKYNDYVLNLFNKDSKSNITTFTNYTLIEYDGRPETFESMSEELKRNIYWVLNGPFGYLNEREKDTYKNLNKNRYSISNYSSIFVSTNCRSIVLYNNLQLKEQSLKEYFNNQRRYESAMIYLFPSIEMILIKKSYYNMISYERFDKSYSVNKIRRKYYDIININDYLFHLRYGGYGSVTRLQEYLEKNLIDYLPAKFLEENIKNYKEILEIMESDKLNKNNFLVATLAMIFPIIFGLNAIESMTQSIDKYLKTSLSKYSFILWIAVIIFIFVVLILSNKIIKKFMYKAKEFSMKLKKYIKNKGLL